MKSEKTLLTLVPGTQKLHLVYLGAKDISCHICRTLVPIFTNRTSFFHELQDESNSIMKFQNFFNLGVWGRETTYGSLGPKRCI